MSKKIMLTTTDNPHSPFDDFPAWYTFDVSSGYNSSGLIARILVDSDQLSETDHDRAVEIAIDEIVRENVSGVHKKVERDIED